MHQVRQNFRVFNQLITGNYLRLQVQLMKSILLRFLLCIFRLSEICRKILEICFIFVENAWQACYWQLT